MNKKGQNKIKNAIDDLYGEILYDNSVDSSKAKDWSIKYFIEHKNRYIEELKTIQTLYKQGKILEIGSLPCHMTYLLNKIGLPVIGSDLDPQRYKWSSKWIFKAERLGHVGYIREYSVKEIKRFLGNCGFEVVELKYRRYHKSKRRAVGSIVDIIDGAIKSFRPDIIFICKKLS